DDTAGARREAQARGDPALRVGGDVDRSTRPGDVEGLEPLARPRPGTTTEDGLHPDVVSGRVVGGEGEQTQPTVLERHGSLEDRRGLVQELLQIHWTIV